MTSESTTIRVGVDQRQLLRDLAEERGASMTDTLDAAMLALKRELFYERMAAAESRLQSDAEGWTEYVAERDLWLESPLEESA